tara:strand:+ start:154 stop:822 length:669 start_codon:yes stop_codon:yes gene_type:complete
MKIAISGASGKTGYRIAEEALSKGHSLRLLVRKKSILPETLNSCERVEISIFNSKQLDQALAGCDVLFIATGARPSIDLTGPAKVDACGVRYQVESSKRVGIKRVILVSSLCSGRWIHPLNLFGLILIWKRAGERALESSGLNWTIIRPGGLNEDESNINSQNILYTQKNTQEDGSIPRRLVAKCCIEALNTKNSVSKIIEITSSADERKTTLEKAINSVNI